MSFELIRNTFPGFAASNIANKQAVALASGVDRGVVPIATSNIDPLGIALAGSGGASQGDSITVYDGDNYVKCVAAASLGRGANVGVVGSTSSLGPVAGASGSVVHAVGKSAEAAAAGETFTLLVRPRQLSGLV